MESIYYGLVEYTIRLGGSLSLLWFIIEVYRREDGKPLHSLAWLGLLLASLMFRLAELHSPGPVDTAWSFVYFNTLLVPLGPLGIIATRRIAAAAPEPISRYRGHFFPVILVFAIETWILFQPQEWFLAQINQLQKGIGFHFFPMLFLVCGIYVVAYAVWATVSFVQMSERLHLSFSRKFWVLLILLLAASTIGMTGLLTFQKGLAGFGGALFTVPIALVYLYTVRYPQFFFNMMQAIKQKKYESVLIDGVDIDAVKKRLIDLMEERGLYLDKSLRLSALAEELNLTPAQVSRIINQQFDQNFNEFINRYRVEEAKKRLVSQPNKTVLSVGFESGFNSKSVFNSQFIHFAGLSPAEYRKKFS